MTDEEVELYRAVVSPLGAIHLMVVEGTDSDFGQAGNVPGELVRSFEQNMFAGLTYLSSTGCDQILPPSIQFWRDFATRYFKALCRQSSSNAVDWISPECPDEAALLELIEAAPPMRGLEYVTAELLATLWRGLDEHTQKKAKAKKGGLASYLHQLRSDWNLVGRVTFHLAENKKNEQRPFAFLATYSRCKAESTAIEHVPLAEALKQSIAMKDSSQLNLLLAPVALAAEKVEVVDELLTSRALFSPQSWSIRQAFDFLSNVQKMEDAGVVVRVPNWWNASKPPRPQVRVRVGSKERSGLGGIDSLDLDVSVAIDGNPLSPEEIEKLMQAREGMTLLRGKWVEVDADRLQSALTQWEHLQREHVTGVDFLEGLRLLSGATLTGNPVDDEVNGYSRLEAGPWLAEMLDTLRDPTNKKIQLDPQHRLQATLRPYQADGVRWLWFATRLGLGVCLADDMGLGKTIQVISLLLQWKFRDESSRTRPSLLIVPTSLLGNWQREVRRFGPDLRMLVAHRSMTDAATLKKIAANPVEELAEYDLVATTYGLARRERWLAKMSWHLVVLDEAQAIKNAGTAQTKAIKAIPGRGRVILTGTPVENDLGDLWSLFDFCSPGLLGTASEFKQFVKPKVNESISGRLSAVRKLIRPYVLRRMKTDPNIVPDLPEKMEMRVDCGLSATQATLYRKVIDEMEQALDVATGIQRRGMVLAALMQLKQICNHPSLYLKSSDFAADASGKFAELRTITEALIAKQEKMLVFTQFQSMCDPLADFLHGVFGRSGLVLTGKTTSARRNQFVKKFQEESGPPFFVVSVRAGGTGLNLTQASHVVHFDRWWNPAVEDQATDRAFRIGQQRNVVVHKFVCRGTLEERIDDMIECKKTVSRELFGGDGEINLTEMSNEELMQFVALDLTKSTTA
ncbi:MAG: DEAD/DEAH box helicase [Pirellulaceae bacterium]